MDGVRDATSAVRDGVRLVNRACRAAALRVATCLTGSLLALAPAHVFATVYRVGPDQSIKKVSDAARLVHSGDTVDIEPMPGGYYDCAVWHADDLTIEGIGNDVRLTDMTCQGKAIFVTAGNRITIRNLTFARARVPDKNGAGIRAEGGDLRVEDSRFIDNESGILAADSPNSKILVSNSQFINNGDCGNGRCTHAIAVDRIAALTVAHSQIIGTKGGDAILSRAADTRLLGNTIKDDVRNVAAYLVELPDGGSLEMEANELERGPLASSGVAVRLMAGLGARQVKVLRFAGNTLRNASHAPPTFVLNWTGTTAQMKDNHLLPQGTQQSTSGYLWFLAKSAMHHGLAAARSVAGRLRRRL